jgi:hypothetical protein
MPRFGVCVICVLPVLGIAASWVAEHQPVTIETVRVEAPAEWVPFTGRKVVKNSSTAPEQHGTYYRRKDGSTALVIESPLGDVITIHNAQTKRTYVRYGDAKGWEEYPLPENAAQVKPPPSSASLKSAKARLSSETIVGSEVLELLSADGTVRMKLAAGLNLEPVFRRLGASGTDELIDVQIGDPPDEVFLPPAGAKIRQRSVAFSKLPPVGHNN